MSAAETARPRSIAAASAILWVVAVALLAAGAAKIAMYDQFDDSVGEAVQTVFERMPEEGFDDASSPGEQFGSVPMYAAYLASATGFILFGVFFLSTAIAVGRARSESRAVAVVGGGIAIVLCAVPNLIDLGWIIAIGASNQADSLVAERVRAAVPTWTVIADNAAAALLVLGSIAAALLLHRPEAKEYLSPRPDAA
ncbi:hypothetical protein [Glycomyces salinus]|uniref:hypothetical protein n=1 Tax=Glycomyces salinus TaxID=980294 RepID=UPI0018EBB405|nr:hypothetical protein [Glycomyces salinus]